MHRVNLHAHARSGSPDSLFSGERMAHEYAAREFSTFAFVGHNCYVKGDGDSLYGCEHGAGNGHQEPHVVELPSVGFSFLAHPKQTYPEDTKMHARRIANLRGLDGVEKFNAGRQQYEGHIEGVAELANDDAHSPWGIGTSYMLVDSPTAAPRHIITAIRNGNHRLVNRGPSLVEKASKGVALARSTIKREWP